MDVLSFAFNYFDCEPVDIIFNKSMQLNALLVSITPLRTCRTLLRLRAAFFCVANPNIPADKWRNSAFYDKNVKLRKLEIHNHVKETFLAIVPSKSSHLTILAARF